MARVPIYINSQSIFGHAAISVLLVNDHQQKLVNSQTKLTPNAPPFSSHSHNPVLWCQSMISKAQTKAAKQNIKKAQPARWSDD